MKKSKILIIIMLVILVLTGVILAQKNELSGLMKPQTMAVEKDRLYITEGATIFIYSLKDFKLYKKFGKQGEGPGEFRDVGFGIKLEIRPNDIVVFSQGRISYFTLDGKFKKEVQVTDPRKGQFQKLGDKFVGTALSRENKKVYFALNIYDKNLKILKEIYRYEHPFFPRSKKINPLNPRVCSFYVNNSKIYFDDKEGNINVFNSEGKKTLTITPSYDKVSVNNIIKKRYIDIWKTNLKPEYNAFKTRFDFPSFCPKIRNFHIIDKKIFILTYKEKDNRNEMLKYTLEGKLTKRTYVPLINTDMLLPNLYNYYTIKNNHLYKLIENFETEKWEISIKKLY